MLCSGVIIIRLLGEDLANSCDQKACCLRGQVCRVVGMVGTRETRAGEIVCSRGILEGTVSPVYGIHGHVTGAGE